MAKLVVWASIKSSIPSLSLSKSFWSITPSKSESLGIHVAINRRAILLEFESDKLIFVIIKLSIRFPLIEKFPVPDANGVLLFKRNRISNEEY